MIEPVTTAALITGASSLLGGGMGKAGSSKGGGGPSADVQKQLFGMGVSDWQRQAPIRKEFENQLLSAITTGGVGAQLPIVSKSVEGSKQATSQAMEAMDERLSTTGLAGTPYGERARAGTQLQGEQATAAIPTNFAQQLISMIPGYTQAAASGGMQGVGSVLGADTQLATTQMGAEAGKAGSALGNIEELFGVGKELGGWLGDLGEDVDISGWLSNLGGGSGKGGTPTPTSSGPAGAQERMGA